MIARRSVRALGLAVAIVVAACGTAPATPPATAPAPSPVQASPNPGLVEFEVHLRDAASREGQLIRDLAAASAASNDRLGLAARRLAAWAAEEQSWLDEHPADACYEDAWLAFLTGVEDIATSAAAFEELAAAASPPTEAQGQAAGATLGSGRDSIDTAADLANQARAACR